MSLVRLEGCLIAWWLALAVLEVACAQPACELSAADRDSFGIWLVGQDLGVKRGTMAHFAVDV